MIKETYTMNVEIEFEFDENKLTAVDAIDKIDYFAKAHVTLDDCDVNILSATLTTKE